ncbi:MAG: alpha-ribazole phosphatase [Candidatus Atribacteria bacterium]|nr:alpha-ribazole phosphatase [Candidatus Atribacteria bacterium]
MKTVYLVRHGDTEATEQGYFAGWSDVPLSPRGKKRVVRVRELLGEIPITRAWVSPLVRTRETAQLLVSPGVPLEEVEEIKERNFGRWEGRRWQELEQEFPQEVISWRKDPLSFTPPGGESFQQVLSRVKVFWEKLLEQEEGNYLVITHAGVIRCLLVHSSGMDFKNTFHLLLDPGVILHLRWSSDFPQLVNLINPGVD